LRKSLLLLPALALLLAGCSSSPSTEPSEAPATVKSETSTAAKDVTAEVQKAAGKAGAAITKAEETEPGRISIETTLVDPRGEDGSAEAKKAIEICEATKDLDGVTYVNVSEKDGTSWVLFGHPSMPKGECSEV